MDPCLPLRPHRPRQPGSACKPSVSLMSLPAECLALLVKCVAQDGVQGLFPLLCVNRTLFFLVVPVLYRDPFGLTARRAWRRSLYRGVIERQTKLIRTLLLCCTRTIAIPISIPTKDAFYPALSSTRLSSSSSSALPLSALTPSIACSAPMAGVTALPLRAHDLSLDCSVGISPRTGALCTEDHQQEQHDGQPHSLISPFLPRRTPSHGQGGTTHFISCHQDQTPTSLFPQQQPHHRPPQTFTLQRKPQRNRSQPQYDHKVERVPIIWDAENQCQETRPIPGLGAATFPPDLARTMLRLQDEPVPMTNYLGHVTHTDIRSWSAALNFTIVHQILGGTRLSWHARLQRFLTRLPKRIMGQHSDGNHGSGTFARGRQNQNAQAGNDIEDEEDDDLTRQTHRSGGQWRRWRGGMRHRHKSLWGLRDVDFVELLLLFYTSSRIESLSLGMNCSHWYHPSLDFLQPGIPERLSGLRKIVIDHADSILQTIPIPQLFIQRHQAAFPGQLREIQVRQSYHHSYDMSKTVLQTIRALDRLEVLDLSIWTGVFSGLETIRTTHLRKLLICHHMEVLHSDMLDHLLEQCLVLEELSIPVPHSRLFAWATDRRRRRNMLIDPGSPTAITDRQSHGQELPPLRSICLFGQTPDVVEAFKDAVFAFQYTLESIQISMYPELAKQSYPQNLSPSGVILNHSPIAQVADVPPAEPESSSPPLTMDPQEGHLQWQWSLPLSTTSAPAVSPTPPKHLAWSWLLPRLRTMSLRGPAVAHFDPGLIQYCPQLTDLDLSLHCSRLPRLVYPGPVLHAAAISAAAAAATSTGPSIVPMPTHPPSPPSLPSSSSRDRLFRALSSSTCSSACTTPVSSMPLSGLPMTFPPAMRYPRIMICDSLAYRWGMPIPRDRRSMVIV